MKHPRCHTVFLLAALICAASPLVSVTLAQGSATVAAPSAAPASLPPTPQPSSQDAGSKIADQTPNSELRTPNPHDDRRLFLADERQESASAPSAAGLLARTLGALLLIIGLIVAAAWA